MIDRIEVRPTGSHRTYFYDDEAGDDVDLTNRQELTRANDLTNWEFELQRKL